MNDVKEFLILFILFFAAFMIVFAALAIARYTFTKQGKETDALDAAQDYALKIISQVGLLLFTDAEKTFGGGTGALKLSAVMDKLIAKLPVWVTELIDMDWLTEQVEIALKRAKDKWQSNPALLSEDDNKPVTSVAMSFDEFVDYGKSNGAHMVNGVPWSFEYKGCAVSHCEDGSYLITTPENGDFILTPNDMLITCSNGFIYPCEINLFNRLYKNSYNRVLI